MVLATRRQPRIVVRAATRKDLSAIVTFRLALLREESSNPLFADPHPDAERRALQLTRMELEAPGQVFLLAVRDGEAVGILRCREVQRTPLVADARQALVTTAYVVPAERQKGVLRALLRAADRWCRQHGLSAMRLQCAVTNDVGQRAWESLGFQAAELLYLRAIPRG
jgi:GNAT superfamily N-acetyltransferase